MAEACKLLQADANRSSNPESDVKQPRAALVEQTIYSDISPQRTYT